MQEIILKLFLAFKTCFSGISNSFYGPCANTLVRIREESGGATRPNFHTSQNFHFEIPLLLRGRVRHIKTKTFSLHKTFLLEAFMKTKFSYVFAKILKSRFFSLMQTFTCNNAKLFLNNQKWKFHAHNSSPDSKHNQSHHRVIQVIIYQLTE